MSRCDKMAWDPVIEGRNRKGIAVQSFGVG